MAPNLESKDYYDVLGVARDASKKDITAAYRALSLKHHPDKNPDNYEQAEENFKNISEAYETLKDPKKREAYDQYGKDGPAPASGGFSPDQADAIFRQMFGSCGHGRMPSRGGMYGGTDFTFMSSDGQNGGYGRPFSGIDIDISQIFEGISVGRNVRATATRSPAHAMPSGASVVVRGLSTATSHNGKTGKVKAFDAHAAGIRLFLKRAAPRFL